MGISRQRPYAKRAALLATATRENATDQVIEETEEKLVEHKFEGHAAHSKSAEAPGLPGAMRRPIKLTMMGQADDDGGGDGLQIPGSQSSTISFCAPYFPQFSFDNRSDV